MKFLALSVAVFALCAHADNLSTSTEVVAHNAHILSVKDNNVSFQASFGEFFKATICEDIRPVDPKGTLQTLSDAFKKGTTVEIRGFRSSDASTICLINAAISL